MTDTCATCRFFYCHRSQGETSRVEEDGSITRTPHATEYRYCRRFPKYEMREPWDWCGEHKPSGQGILDDSKPVDNP